MTVLDVLNSRQSVKADLLNEPAPTDDLLAQVLQTAMSAPDHGAIRPWRFHVIKGDARLRLSDVFEEALLLRDPDADEAAITKIRSKPMRAPMIVVVSAVIHEDHPKVPAIEQVLAVGGATQNILNACFASNIGAVLVTGWVAFDRHVKKSFGLLEKDAIIGFIYMGTAPDEMRLKKRPDAKEYTHNWTGQI